MMVGRGNIWFPGTTHPQHRCCTQCCTLYFGTARPTHRIGAARCADKCTLQYCTQPTGSVLLHTTASVLHTVLQYFTVHTVLKYCTVHTVLQYCTVHTCTQHTQQGYCTCRRHASHDPPGTCDIVQTKMYLMLMMGIMVIGGKRQHLVTLLVGTADNRQPMTHPPEAPTTNCKLF